MIPYFNLAMESWKLWADASAVIWMRGVRIAQGGALADREAERMVQEKLTANMMLGWSLWPVLASGGSEEALMRRSVAHYGKTVRANRRRLAKAKR